MYPFNVTSLKSVTQSPQLFGDTQDPFGLRSLTQSPELAKDYLNEKDTPDAQALMDMLLMVLQVLMGMKKQMEQLQQQVAKASEGAKGAEGASAAEGAKGAESGEVSNQFLWKPESESDGNLVVLLPNKLKGDVEKVEIFSQDGKLLDTGKFSGDEKNGNRPHYRFDKSGGEYGDNVKVVVTTKSGEKVDYDIGKGADRNE